MDTVEMPLDHIERTDETSGDIAVHEGDRRSIANTGGSQQAHLYMGMIERAARDPSVDVAKMQALLEMQREVRREEAEALFNQAFIRLGRKLPRIKKNGSLEYPINKNDPDGPKRKIANFARWEDIMREITPFLDEEGFRLSFESAPRAGEGGGLLVTGILLHEAGHTRQATIPLPLDSSGGKNNLQGYGSTFSYGKRYTATMLLNIVTEGEDDDGVRGATEFISAETASAITAELNKRGIPFAIFCDLLDVRSVEEIEVKNLPAARNALKSYKPRQGTAP